MNSTKLPPSLVLVLQSVINRWCKQAMQPTTAVFNKLDWSGPGSIHKQKMPILWPYAVKYLTCNIELIQMLWPWYVIFSARGDWDCSLLTENGHITRWSDDSYVLPTNSVLYAVTNLAFDNIDRMKETSCGGGTSHRVNGIAIQPLFYGPIPEQPALLAIHKKYSTNTMSSANL